jgi:hypothetical protein
VKVIDVIRCQTTPTGDLKSRTECVVSVWFFAASRQFAPLRSLVDRFCAGCRNPVAGLAFTALPKFIFFL